MKWLGGEGVTGSRRDFLVSAAAVGARRPGGKRGEGAGRMRGRLRRRLRR